MIVTDLLIYLIKTPHCSAWPVTAKTLLCVPGGEMQGYKLRGGRAGELHYWRKRDQRMDNFLRLFSYFFILAQESSSVESLLINFGTHFPGSRFIDFQLRKATLVSHSGPQCQLWPVTIPRNSGPFLFASRGFLVLSYCHCIQGNSSTTTCLVFMVFVKFLLTQISSLLFEN